MSAERFIRLLGARSAAVGSRLCLGLDPDPGALPAGFSRDLAGLERFTALLLETALPHAAAVKANLAFFEAYGGAGVAMLERLRGAIPSDVPFIADAKRADVAATSARIASAIFDVLGADAMTVNPYLGSDALRPMLEREDRFVYVLCRTSNPGAGELQDLRVVDSAPGGTAGPGGEPIYLHVARRAGRWAGSAHNVGLVVGATAPAELARVREAAPELPFLVPGVGAQGGELAPVLEHGPARAGAAAQQAGGGLLINVSRAIAATAGDADDPAASIARAAAFWSGQLR